MKMDEVVESMWTHGTVESNGESIGVDLPVSANETEIPPDEDDFDRMNSHRSKAAAKKRQALTRGTAWVIGALLVAFVDLRFLAIPPLGIAGMLIAMVMGIVGFRHLGRGFRISPYDLLALAAERDGGLLNAATVVKAYNCSPEDATRAIHEGLKAGLLEDVTPPAGKTLVVRSLASDNLAASVEEGQEALDRAMHRLDAELAGDVVDEFDAELEAAREKDGGASGGARERERE